MGKNFKSAKRVLIYRLGSIGDTVVALPCFKLIARVFPNAERRVLTNFPDGVKAAPMDTILGPMNLVNGYFKYPLKTRHPRKLYRLMIEISSWEPDVLVYLAHSRGRLKPFRDALFFKACGITELIGVPLSKDQQKIRKLDLGELWESEASRLARCISKLGDAEPNNLRGYDMCLTSHERYKAHNVMAGWEGRHNFVSASIGAKADSKDWGIDNWGALLDKWSKLHPGVGLVLAGGADEFKYSQALTMAWRGPVLNLCGKLSPRETAAVLEMAHIFVGHDSGPMHLSAAVGTPCVAIFSAQNFPGKWFPIGNQHKVIYHRTPCYGCKLDICKLYNKICIRSITVDEIYTSILQLIKSELIKI